MEWAAVQPIAYSTLGYHGLLSTFENVLILLRVLRPRRICDIYDLFAPFINLLTYYLVTATFEIQVGLTLEPGTRFKHYQIIATIVRPHA